MKNTQLPPTPRVVKAHGAECAPSSLPRTSTTTTTSEVEVATLWLAGLQDQRGWLHPSRQRDGLWFMDYR